MLGQRKDVSVLDWYLHYVHIVYISKVNYNYDECNSYGKALKVLVVVSEDSYFANGKLPAPFSATKSRYLFKLSLS